MQDRYAGDIGDYGKFGLLKALQNEGLTIGINWYRTNPIQQEFLPTGAYKQQDGRHLIPESLFQCDMKLARALSSISNGANRSVAALKSANLIPNAKYYSDTISIESRKTWHEMALKTLNQVDLVFLDPDNGLLVDSVSKTASNSVKYVFYEEVSDYVLRNQSVVIYNHRCRKKPKEYFGGILEKLLAVDTLIDKRKYVLTFSKGTVRDYFAICSNDRHALKIQSAFESLAYGIWGRCGMCRLQSFPYKQCLSCGNDKLVPILYGMPSSDAKVLEDEKLIYIGGCCIEDDSPNWYCMKCKKAIK